MAFSTPTPQQFHFAGQKNNHTMTKAESDLFDHIVTFLQIQLHKHDIDKIKTDDRINAANYAIRASQQKLELGKQIIETILKQRLKFIQRSQEIESILMKLQKEIIDDCQIELWSEFSYSHFQDQVIIQQNQGLQNSKVLFQAGFHKKYLHDDKWKQTIKQQANGNVQIMGMIDFDLLDCSNAFYHKFNKFLQNLQSIYGNVQKEQYVLNDAQIQRLLQFLQEVNEEFKANSVIHFQMVLHLWLDDVIRVQNGFQLNLHQLFYLLGQLDGNVTKVVTYIKNIELRIDQIQQKNQKVVRILKKMILPQRFDNQNLTYTVQCQELLIKIQKRIQSTGEEIKQDLMIEVIIFEARDADENFKPQGLFKGPMEFIPRNVNILLPAIQNQQNILTQKLNNIQIEFVCVNNLFQKFKELIVAEKKLTKAQTLFKELESQIKNHLYGKEPLNQGTAMLCHRNMLKLQKYVNMLSESLDVATVTSEMLPKINPFLQTIQKFVGRCHQLCNEAVEVLGLK
ncbi:hypothetical protein pb186bvf_018637 [Paramecium bursaria]